MEDEVKIKEKRGKDGDVVWAVFLIFLGIMFLANNLGILPWSVWGTLWRFWPVLLIFSGIQMFMGESSLARMLFAVLLVVFVAGAIMYAVFSGIGVDGGQFGREMPMWRYGEMF